MRGDRGHSLRSSVGGSSSSLGGGDTRRVKGGGETRSDKDKHALSRIGRKKGKGGGNFLGPTFYPRQAEQLHGKGKEDRQFLAVHEVCKESDAVKWALNPEWEGSQYSLDQVKRPGGQPRFSTHEYDEKKRIAFFKTSRVASPIIMKKKRVAAQLGTSPSSPQT